MAFNLKHHCANCPFRREGAIELMPGCLHSIVESLRHNDNEVFICHKTVYSARGRKSGGTEPRGSVCAGALAYMHREGRLPVAARVAVHYGTLSLDDVNRNIEVIVDPIDRPPKS